MLFLSTDTLKLSVGADTIDATATTGELINVTGFEKIDIASTDDAAVLDMNGVTGVTSVIAAANVKVVTIAASTGAVNPTTFNFTLNGVSDSFTADCSGNEAADKVAIASAMATKIGGMTGFTAVSDGIDKVTVTATTGETVELSVTNPANTTVTVADYKDVTFSNLAAGVAVDIYSGDKITANLKDGSGSADALSVNLKTTTADRGFNHTVGTFETTLVETINHERMPVLLTTEDEFATWLNGTPTDAMSLARRYPPECMRIVQEGFTKQDMFEAA